MVAKKGEDDYAWIKYPQHHNWFNKLWIAEQFGYKCGPAGTDIPEDGVYVIRPIYNLSGMGLGAHVKELKADDCTTPPGYFWCEYFNGLHYSANYEWKWDRDSINGKWEGTSCWEGTNFPINLTRFEEWKKIDYIPKLPTSFDTLSDVGEINVEFIDDKIIEVHLRKSPDPDYQHMIPLWKSDYPEKKDHYLMHGYKYVEAYDDADKHLKDPRLGFLVK